MFSRLLTVLLVLAAQSQVAKCDEPIPEELSMGSESGGSCSLIYKTVRLLGETTLAVRITSVDLESDAEYNVGACDATTGTVLKKASDPLPWVTKIKGECVEFSLVKAPTNCTKSSLLAIVESESSYCFYFPDDSLCAGTGAGTGASSTIGTGSTSAPSTDSPSTETPSSSTTAPQTSSALHNGMTVASATVAVAAVALMAAVA